MVWRHLWLVREKLDRVCQPLVTKQQREEGEKLIQAEKSETGRVRICFMLTMMSWCREIFRSSCLSLLLTCEPLGWTFRSLSCLFTSWTKQPTFIPGKLIMMSACDDVIIVAVFGSATGPTTRRCTQVWMEQRICRINVTFALGCTARWVWHRVIIGSLNQAVEHYFSCVQCLNVGKSF